MNRRLTLILFLIFAAMVILAYSLRNETGKQVGPNAPTPTPGPMWALDAKAVSKVEVSGAGNAYTLALVDGKWQVDNQPANDQVAGIVERASSPTVLRALPSDRDPKTYGFASPTLTVTFSVSETAYTLLVGDTLPTSKTDRYVMTKGGTTIFSVGGADLTTLTDWLTAPPLAPTATPPPTAEGGTPGTAEAGTMAPGTAEVGTVEAGTSQAGTPEAGTVEPPEPGTAAPATTGAVTALPPPAATLDSAAPTATE